MLPKRLMHLRNRITKVPVRKYRTFDQYLQAEREKYGCKHEYVCTRCSGSGRIVDPKEVPDVIEGHKLSKRIDCPTCFGSGDCGRDVKKSQYDSYRKEYQFQADVAKRLRREEKIALAKIEGFTDSDIEAIGRLIDY